jgi:hypothetical protein
MVLALQVWSLGYEEYSQNPRLSPYHMNILKRA